MMANLTPPGAQICSPRTQKVPTVLSSTCFTGIFAGGGVASHRATRCICGGSGHVAVGYHHTHSVLHDKSHIGRQRPGAKRVACLQFMDMLRARKKKYTLQMHA